MNLMNEIEMVDYLSDLVIEFLGVNRLTYVLGVYANVEGYILADP